MIIIMSHGWNCRRRLGGNCRLVIVLSVLTAVMLCSCTRYPDYIRQPVVVNTKPLPNESAGLYSPDSQPMPTVAPGNYYQSSLNSNDQYNQPNLNAQPDARSQPWQANAAQQAQQPPQTISSNDYIYYPTHPKANKAGFIRVIRDNYNPQIDSQNQQWDPQNPPARNQTYNTQETTGYNGQYQGYAGQPAISGANQQFVESSTPSLQHNPQWQTRPTGTAPNIQIGASQGTDRSYNPGQLAADRTPTVSNVTVTGIGEPAPAPSGLAPVAPDAQPVPLDNTNINTAIGISQTENQYNKNVEFPSIDDIERMKTYKTQIAKTGEAPIKEKMPTSITFGNDYPAKNPLSQPSIKPVEPTQQAATQATADTIGTVDKIGDSIIHLERYVASHPDDAKAQLTLRLLYSVYGNDDKALQYLPSTPTEKQSQSRALAQALLLTTQAGLDTDHNEAQAANQALKALESLTKKLSDQADPVISCVKICNENVTGFGKYEVISDEDLQTGLPRTIKVYCELENIKARLNEEGKYYTDLYAEFTLYDSQLRPQAELKSDVPDTPIYNQRRDFCLWGPLTLPKLSPGKYQITVRVEDKLAGRIAQTKNYEFEVK